MLCLVELSDNILVYIKEAFYLGANQMLDSARNLLNEKKNVTASSRTEHNVKREKDL
jgi:hypothetical protein